MSSAAASIPPASSSSYHHYPSNASNSRHMPSNSMHHHHHHSNNQHQQQERPVTPYDMNKLDPETEAELWNAFQQFDKDGGGELDRNELKSLLESLGKPCTEEDMDQIMATVDEDGSGSVDFREFCFVAVEKLTGSTEGGNGDPEEMSLIFKFFDLNNDGRISFDELYQVINNKMDLQLSKKSIEDMMRYADRSGDGFVSLNEFQSLLSTQELKTPRYMRIQNEKEKKSKQALWKRFTRRRKKPKRSRGKKSKSPSKKKTLEKTTSPSPSNKQQPPSSSFFLTQVPVQLPGEDTLHHTR